MQTAVAILRRLSHVSAALLCILLALPLNGCGNSPYPPGETARPVLYLSLRDDPITLDPTTSFSTLIVDSLFSAYFEYHYLKRDPNVLVLNLGAEAPRRAPYFYTVLEQGRPVRKQGESWTFRIKPNLRFQDDPCFPGGKGRIITADDFLYSFRRNADPAVASPWSSALEEKVLGFAAYLAANRERAKYGLPADYTAPVAGLQRDPRDPYTFRILLTMPFPQLKYFMALRLTAPQAHEASERYGKEIARHPVGCGPYKLLEYKPKQRIVLVRNPNCAPQFYPTEGAPGDREAGLLADAGRPLPRTEKIVFTVIREGVTSWSRFLQGYEDMWAVTQTNYQQVVTPQGRLTPQMQRMGIHLLQAFSPSVSSYFFNMSDPVFGGYTPQKRKLRQAISMALDSQTYIDLLAQGNGTPAQFYIPPGLFGYDPAFHNPYRVHDLTKARRLLAEAGYPGGVDPKTGERLTLYYDNSATDAAGRQTVGIVSRMIEELGVHVESRTGRSTVMRERVDKGRFQFISHLWIADYPDPEMFLYVLYGPNRRPGPNMCDYENPTYDRLFERMRSMEDGPERAKLIRKMREIVVEDCPIIYVKHDVSLLITHGWIKNNKPPNVDREIYKYLGVDGAERARLQAEWNRPNLAPAFVGAGLLLIGSLPAVRIVRQRKRRRLRRPRGMNG